MGKGRVSHAGTGTAAALEQAGLAPDELDYVLAGDLLNQCIGSSFGLRDFSIPFFGLYGACSTMGGIFGAGGHAH